MIAHALHRFLCSLVALAAAASLTGCGDESALGPEDRPAIAASALRGVDLGDCDELRVPEGSTLVFHAYAEGVQIYQWDGTGWAFRGPSAKLYADAAGTGTVGIHYGGPTWESNSGSLVVGTLSKPCERGPTDIPWLLLNAVRSEGPGIFHRVAFIQRVNTVGGRAPTAPGSPGEVRNVPYTAEYFFYRAP
jgi:hypothetical protein